MRDFKQWDSEEAEKAKERTVIHVDKETARLESFSDGVFAIAITLLVLLIRVPPVSSAPLAHQLWELWPSYFAYVVSFFTILVIWMNHHRLFQIVRKSDEWLNFTNGLLLLVVCFVPFPTAVMATHWATDREAGVLFYTGTFILLSVVFHVLWYCISHKNRLVDPDLDKHRIDGISRQYMVGPLMYLVAFIVGIWQPEMCLAMNMLYAFYFAIPSLHFARASEESEAT